MKKLFTLVALVVTIFSFNGAIAQPCTINTSNTTSGFTPTTPPSIVRNMVYGQTVQVYAPTTYTYMGIPVTIDSIHIASIAGLPTSINYSFNPASGTVAGGQNGCIWFSGTTTDTVGTYTLAFSGTAYTSLANVPLSTLASQFGYVFTVVAGAAAPTCDTLVNFSASDTPTYYSWQAPSIGYVSGSGAISNSGNLYPQTGVAEEFTAAATDTVESAVLFFAYATTKAADSLNTVKVYVYDNTGTDLLGGAGAPGNAIDSATLTLKSIDAAITTTYATSTLTPNMVTFPHHVPLTTGSFFVGVSTPTTTGDTIVVFTNTGSTGYGRGWIGLSIGWLGYDSIIGNTGTFIIADVCGTAFPPVAAFTQSATSGCAPVAVTFTDASTGGTGYSWNFGDGTAASTAQNPSHTYTTAGNYTVTETVTGTGGSATFSSSVTVNAAPATTVYVTNATTSSSADGAAGVVVNGGTGTNTYAWSNSTTTDSISGVTANTYYVTVTNSNTCRTIDTVVVSFGSGINTLGANAHVKIYPNPANDQLNFEWNVNNEATITIYDITGQAIRSYMVNGSVTKLDIHEFASGLYVLRVVDKTNNEQQSLTFTKF